PYIRGGRDCQYRNTVIRNSHRSNAMNRRLVPSPALPLIDQFGPLIGENRHPVRLRRNPACKCLISMSLSRVTGSNFSAYSMLHPVFPAFTGVGEIAGAPCQSALPVLQRAAPLTTPPVGRA